MLPTLAVERMIGLPTRDGKICEGKLLPAYPHFTNYYRNKRGRHRERDNIYSLYR